MGIFDKAKDSSDGQRERVSDAVAQDDDLDEEPPGDPLPDRGEDEQSLVQPDPSTEPGSGTGGPA